MCLTCALSRTLDFVDVTLTLHSPCQQCLARSANFWHPAPKNRLPALRPGGRSLSVAGLRDGAKG